jgi:hypothetical protein
MPLPSLTPALKPPAVQATVVAKSVPLMIRELRRIIKSLELGGGAGTVSSPTGDYWSKVEIEPEAR